MENQVSERIRVILFTAMFIALVFVSTYIRIYVPIGGGTGGLMHIGTLVMFTIALKYGPRYGAIAGGVGMAMFDVLSEWVIWAPGTLIVRLVSGYVVGLLSRSPKGQGRNLMNNIIALLAGGAVIVVGYFIYEAWILGIGWPAAASAVGNLVQVTIGFASLHLIKGLPDLKPRESI